MECAPLRTENAGRLKVLVTGHEAYPEFERCFLAAKEEVVAGFRIFDPDTKLRSEEARAIGEDWFDLMVHTLKRGVRIDLILADFDPLIASDTHRCTWSSMRRFAAIREMAGSDAAPFYYHASMHPSRVGYLPRLGFWWKILKEIDRTCRELNEMSPERRRRSLEEMPGFRPWIVVNEGSGRVCRPARWPVPPLVPCTHHQKLAVFDREKLYIGGLDLDERRYDTDRHDQPAPQTWQDVQILVDDPEPARAAHAHLTGLLDEVHRRKPVQTYPPLRRTLAQCRRFRLPFISPSPVATELAEAHFDLIDRSEGLIYLESQFMRDYQLARKLARRARQVPGLKLILVLPGAPEEVAFEHRKSADMRFGEHLQAKAVAKLRRAFRDRMFVGAPAQARDVNDGEASDRGTLYGAPLIYVHTKVSIFDDKAAIVSSANLNGRSLYWDTEAGLVLDDPAEVRQVKRKVMSHWLPDEDPQRYFDPATAVQAWRVLANTNEVSKPAGRKGFILPYRERKARRFGRPLPLIPDNMV